MTNSLTTIAALPRTGGAGMALRGETNTKPKPAHSVDSAVIARRNLYEAYAAEYWRRLNEAKMYKTVHVTP